MVLSNEFSEKKRHILDWVDDNTKRLSDFHQEIWGYAEPAWREYKSSKAYVKLLREEGFEVDEGSGEMPTAFCASWGEGKPVIGGYVEYDATPGTSQKQVTHKETRDGFHPYAAGHTDPHSALGVASLFGFLAAKRVMEDYGLKGALKLFGEPAEKVCGSKPVHAAKGYFDDLDVAISWHPGPSNVVRGEIQAGSYWSVLFTFECIEPEAWFNRDLGIRRGSHAGGRCPAALDAVCLMYTTTKYTKEAMLPHTGIWTLNEFIMLAGQCTSDNLPPRISQIQYAWRSPTLAMQQQIYDVLWNNAKHIAAVTSCVVTPRWITKTRIALPNLTMANLVYENMELAGPPEYGEEALNVLREIQMNVGLDPMDDPLHESCITLISPREADENYRSFLPEWQKNFSSDDYVEYSWHAPCARYYMAKAVPAQPGEEVGFFPSGKEKEKSVDGENHGKKKIDFGFASWVWNALSGIRSTIDPCTVTSAKVMGMSIVDVLTKPATLKKAQEEFNKRTGGGIGGKKWVAPLLPEDFEPPVDLKWPEYVTTPRGYEWCIPTPKKN